jgi:hypothetical protein
VLQNLDIFAEPAVVPAQLRQLQPLRASQPAVAAGPGVRPRLTCPRPDRRLDQVNILCHRGGGPVLALAQLNDLGQELVANPRRRWGLFCMPKRRAERRGGWAGTLLGNCAGPPVLGATGPARW